MKTTRLLHILHQQLEELRTRVAPLAHYATLSARFDRHLFKTRSTLLQACVDEAQGHYDELCQAVERKQLPQVAWLAEHLSAQIEAITRETTSWSLRGWDNGSAGITKWQRKRLQHQEFERRLIEMKAQRVQQHAQAASLADQQRLAREIDAFSGRLERCQRALADIERVLAQLTR
ncbi:primosomal replication protein N'' [Superficieibacter sp. HKU1]|uniref:primosomal replication protein N'' n=1 Tax=Superficieibacter sp. HKU1 TaxID=3031919 RepID=UPI0023E23CAF|nr:primosomal replication protein N'' [Superficieibacter sp. HKU1]WES69602.1 primosomal replication protein N'' [Superficieibacter sp. HKU1]